MAARCQVPDIHGVSSTTSLTSFEEDDSSLLKRKTPLQLQTLENLYSVDSYPTQSRMEDYALALAMTYKQVRGWFIERRRKEKNGGARSSRVKTSNKGSSKRKNSMNCSDTESEQDERAMVKRPVQLQDRLLSPDYIVTKVFRKDGPPLGVEFNSLPSSASQRWPDSESHRSASEDEQTMLQTKKNTRPSSLDYRQNKLGASSNKHGKGKGFITAWHALNCQNGSQAIKRRKVLPSDHLLAKQHGVGKGLMTAWRAMHPCNEGYLSYANEGGISVSQVVNPKLKKPVARNKRPQRQKAPINWRRLGDKLHDKTSSKRRRKVGCGKTENQHKAHRVECRLAFETVTLEDHCNSSELLVDDEELELRELQAGPNPLTCIAHFSTSARHGCPLCKGLLAKFPPDSVTMKRPFHNQSWDSSLELMKKFFKVFQFLYTYDAVVNTCPFTMDDFIQAFHDKDSCLLGELHVCLLKLLLSDVSKELYDAVLPPRNKNCMFLSLLHSVQSRKYIFNFWNEALNALTWIEILRQILLAAGYGSSDGNPKKEAPRKQMDPMARYGLLPGTLKGELFSILSEEGNQGIRLSDLAESSRIVDLNLANAKDKLEELISSTLASDITLFEKISCSTYRLRLKNLPIEDEDSHTDSEDSGSIDYSSKGCGISRSSDDFDCDSRSINSSKSKNSCQSNCEVNMRSPGTEIDESHSGEAWMFGLMEGEYSDLSIEEKLHIMVALVDLLCAGSSIRRENVGTTMAECVPKIYQHGSGAKIKRASSSQHRFFFPERDGVVQNQGRHSSTEFQPIDSACVLRGKDISSRKELHPMQSIFLGSDRRYNRYWLFLGPCHASDPGHRRVYFESSEDGHFEVIDTTEALCALIGALDGRGKREAVLLASLKKRAPILCDEISAGESISMSDRLPTQSDQSELDKGNCESLSPVSDVDNHSCLMPTCLTSSSSLVSKFGKNIEEETLKWSRLQAYDLWIWNSFYSNLHSVKHKKHSYLDTLMRCEACHDLYWRDEKHCRFCHTTFELDFDLEEKYAIHAATCQGKEDSTMFPKHKVLPSQLQALKATVHRIELAMPENSLIGAWAKSAHKLWIKRLRRTSSLQELLQALGNFVDAINKDWLSQCNASADCEDIITCFRNMPQTSSALALWLVKLDALVAASEMQRNQ